MKTSIGLLIIAAVIYFYEGEKSTIDLLMEVDYPIVTTKESGSQEYTPTEGSVVDMAELIEPGLINIVHIYAASCGGCQAMDNNIAKLLSIRPDVAVTSLVSTSIVNYQAKSLGKTLNIEYVPFILVFDRNGKHIAINDGENSAGSALVFNWVNAEIERKNKQDKEQWRLNH